MKRIKKEIAKSKRKYTENISEHVAKETSNAWSDFKKLGGPANNDKQISQPIDVDPVELNQFVARFKIPFPI